MSDLIDRQAAIDAIVHKLCIKSTDFLLPDEERIIDVIRNIPSAEPERKKGEWIQDSVTYYQQYNAKNLGVYAKAKDIPYFTDDIACPECLAKFSVIDNETERFNFCPWCGSDLRGDE